MLTHFPLGDGSTRLQRHPLRRTSMFRRISLLISWAWVNAAHEHHSYTSDAYEQHRLPQMSGAYHFDSSQPTHLQCPRINASQPPRSKPYCTNRREEEGLTWPFASSPAVYNKGVATVRRATKFTENSMRYTLQLMVATMCGRKHRLPNYTTQENRLTGQPRNQTQTY